MSYCPKCGNKVDETMAFCPRCGASLRGAVPGQAGPVPPPTYRRRRDEKSEKGEKREKQEPEKGEKQEKGEYGYIGWLIGGLILILIGLFSILRISRIIPTNEGSWAIMLLLIGVIIIVAAVYLTTMARKRHPAP